jgi:16S rRNA (cytosine1402-N4)-methyltransferase
MDDAIHRPVLLQEAIEALACRPGGLWIDGTIGAGGHAEAILRASSPGGRLIGCDRDAEILEHARRRLAPFGERAVLRHIDHRGLPDLLAELDCGPADGILLDLGVSSLQFDDPSRGFSFQREGPLDMRMDRTQPTSAADLVNRLPKQELRSLLARYGEERAAGRIAGAIVRSRDNEPIRTTTQLARIVAAAAGPARSRRIHPATRAFQALRIAVNEELDGLDRRLEALIDRLASGGRIAVIAFHSLEDRVVKQTFRSLSHRCRCPRNLPLCACGRPDMVRLVTGRAVRPSADEIDANPRSRSARLRAAERLEAAA